MSNEKRYIVDLRQHVNYEIQVVKSFSYRSFRDAIAKAIQFAKEGNGRFALLSNYTLGFKRTPYVEIYSSMGNVKINTYFEPALQVFQSLLDVDCTAFHGTYDEVEVDTITGHPLSQAQTPHYNIVDVTVPPPFPADYYYYVPPQVEQDSEEAEDEWIHPYEAYGLIPKKSVEKQRRREEEKQKEDSEKAELEKLIVKPPKRRQIDLE